MKIKLKESQLINILKKEYDHGSLKEDVNQFSNFLQMWAQLKKDSENEISSADTSYPTSGLRINPNFDVENAEANEFTTINLWPLNNTKINSPFGPRNIGGGASKNHGGVDLYAKSGTPIYSVANGVVKSARDTTPNGCGGFIQIDHGKHQTKYCHVRKWVVKEGDEVIKGQLIGYTGGGTNDPYKGNSMGAHLHYEVLVSGRNVNPEKVHTRLS